MSQLKVETVIVEIEPHPNADKLEVARIVGKLWRCVVVKDQFKSLDLALYIPTDAVLPETLVKSLGIEKYYSKRLRAARLRGIVSQGLVAPLSILPPGTYPGPRGFERMPEPGQDFTELLGITKYDPPIPVSMAGIQRSEHGNFDRYTDIERLDNHPTVFKNGDMVVVSEKIHGTNARFAKIDGELHVGSHRCSWLEAEGNLYWRAAKMLDIANKLEEGEEVFGEIYGSGIQDLAYGKKPGEIAVAIFDIKKGGRFLDYTELLQSVLSRGWELAPVLSVGEYGPYVTDMAEGNSTIAPAQIREGIVVRPFKEQFSEKLSGRLIIKILGTQYLLRKDGTENH